MLVEDFNKENIMIDYIITECKRLKCMDSLNAFMLGDTKYSVIGRDSYGTYTPKTVIKSKKLPHLLFKESDSLLRKNKAPFISKDYQSLKVTLMVMITNVSYSYLMTLVYVTMGIIMQTAKEKTNNF